MARADLSRSSRSSEASMRAVPQNTVLPEPSIRTLRLPEAPTSNIAVSANSYVPSANLNAIFPLPPDFSANSIAALSDAKGFCSEPSAVASSPSGERLIDVPANAGAQSARKTAAAIRKMLMRRIYPVWRRDFNKKRELKASSRRARAGRLSQARFRIAAASGKKYPSPRRRAFL